jgi:hypothetical protein
MRCRLAWTRSLERLVGICFRRDAPETAVGGVFAALRLPKPDRRAEAGIFKDQGSRRQPRQPGLTRGIALIPV